MDANRDTIAFLPKHEIPGPSSKCTQLSWRAELTPPNTFNSATTYNEEQFNVVLGTKTTRLAPKWPQTREVNVPRAACVHCVTHQTARAHSSLRRTSLVPRPVLCSVSMLFLACTLYADSVWWKTKTKIKRKISNCMWDHIRLSQKKILPCRHRYSMVVVVVACGCGVLAPR